jgi:hypothetical protein
MIAYSHLVGATKIPFDAIAPLTLTKPLSVVAGT